MGCAHSSKDDYTKRSSARPAKVQLVRGASTVSSSDSNDPTGKHRHPTLDRAQSLPAFTRVTTLHRVGSCVKPSPDRKGPKQTSPRKCMSFAAVAAQTYSTRQRLLMLRSVEDEDVQNEDDEGIDAVAVESSSTLASLRMTTSDSAPAITDEAPSEESGSPQASSENPLQPPSAEDEMEMTDL